MTGLGQEVQKPAVERISGADGVNELGRPDRDPDPVTTLEEGPRQRAAIAEESGGAGRLPGSAWIHRMNGVDLARL